MDGSVLLNFSPFLLQVGQKVTFSLFLNLIPAVLIRITLFLERNKFKQKNLEDGKLNGKHDQDELEAKNEGEDGLERTHQNSNCKENVENESEPNVKTSTNDNQQNKANNDENELSVDLT